MSVLLKVSVLSGITCSIESRNGEPVKKSRGACGQMKNTTTTTTKLGLKAPYILYEKDCTIQAKNDETVTTPK